MQKATGKRHALLASMLCALSFCFDFADKKGSFNFSSRPPRFEEGINRNKSLRIIFQIIG